MVPIEEYYNQLWVHQNHRRADGPQYDENSNSLGIKAGEYICDVHKERVEDNQWYLIDQLDTILLYITSAHALYHSLTGMKPRNALTATVQHLLVSTANKSRRLQQSCRV